MLGHLIPNEIFDLLNHNEKIILSQTKGKLTFSKSNDLYNAVGILIRKPNEEVFSLTKEERNYMNDIKIPIVTVGSNKDISETFLPDRYFENSKFLSRPFIHGVFDCYTLIKDYYRVNFNVFLPTNIQRTWEWWLQGDNLYVDNAKRYGFEEVTDIKIHDVIIMKLNSEIPNHGAIYIGNNNILHHISGRFSTTEELTAFYKQNIAVIYRYTKNVN
jgi:cell wall-associated NlpC family hydrolase